MLLFATELPVKAAIG